MIRLRTLFLAAALILAGRSAPRAGEDSAPRKVIGSFDLTNITAINEQKQQFQIDGYAKCIWVDPELAFDPAKTGKSKLSYTDEAVWDFFNTHWFPDFEIINRVGQPRRSNATLDIGPDGTVVLVWRLEATLTARMCLARFPFDTQRLELQIESFTYSEADMVFEVNRNAEKPPQPSEILSQAWQLTGTGSGVSTSRALGENYSRLTFAYTIKRSWGSYVWRTFLPLLLIAALGWAVFLMGEKSIAERITHLMTCLLAALALNFVVNVNLPQLSYLTVLDKLFVAAYAGLFAAAAEAAAAALLEKKSLAAALRLDHACLIVVPLLTLAAMVTTLQLGCN